MKLLALILGLLLERTATQLLHLRELRWFDGYFDWGLERAKAYDDWRVHAVVLAVLLVPAVPVLLVSIWLLGADVRWDLPYLAFAVLVVFLCLGPRDLGNEIDEYCDALERGDESTARRVLVELSEAGDSGDDAVEVVEDAVFLQAVNRIFGVVFWFVVLGPVGAWIFRISDLLRRRAAFESVRRPELAVRVLPAVQTVFAFLQWAPVQLAALGYALTGNFEEAVNGWREYRPSEEVPLHRRNDELSMRVGKAAMRAHVDEPANPAAAATKAMRLVTRTVFIWITLIAIMTLFGWSI